MKIVFTAEHAGDLSAFHQLGELLVEGWALGKPKLSAGQLIELAHDAEVLVTSYDEVTDAVMAACPRLQVIACTRANPVNIDTQAAQARGLMVRPFAGDGVRCTIGETEANDRLIEVAREFLRAAS